jgi:hypothetical protein
MPAGYLYIEGHAALRREEMLGLLTHHEMRARGEHPLQRIITIKDEGHRMVVTTTDVHLARDLAMALKGAFHGECKFKYSRGDQLLRAYWRR